MSQEKDTLLQLRDARPEDTVPADCRLRRVLKSLLRVYGFRCVRVEEVPIEAKAPSARKKAAARRVFRQDHLPLQDAPDAD